MMCRMVLVRVLPRTASFSFSPPLGGLGWGVDLCVRDTDLCGRDTRRGLARIEASGGWIGGGLCGGDDVVYMLLGEVGGGDGWLETLAQSRTVFLEADLRHFGALGMCSLHLGFRVQPCAAVPLP